LRHKQCWQLAINNNKLYAVTDGGLFEYDGKSYKKIINGNFRKVKFLKNGKILIGGTIRCRLNPIHTKLKFDYNFIFEIAGEILGIEEEPSNKAFHYWVSTQSAVYKITDDESPVFKVDAYGEDFGLPKIGNTLLYSTTKL
jgi:hypothetical protein